MALIANAHELDRPCPQCGAEPGADCATSGGRPLQNWRLWNNDLNSYVLFRGVHALRSRPLLADRKERIDGLLAEAAKGG